MKDNTSLIIVFMGLFLLIAILSDYYSENRIKSHIDAELQTLKPVMSNGRCFIVKVPEGGL